MILLIKCIRAESSKLMRPGLPPFSEQLMRVRFKNDERRVRNAGAHSGRTTASEDGARIHVQLFPQGWGTSEALLPPPFSYPTKLRRPPARLLLSAGRQAGSTFSVYSSFFVCKKEGVCTDDIRVWSVSFYEYTYIVKPRAFAYWSFQCIVVARILHESGGYKYTKFLSSLYIPSLFFCPFFLFLFSPPLGSLLVSTLGPLQCHREKNVPIGESLWDIIEKNVSVIYIIHMGYSAYTFKESMP